MWIILAWMGCEPRALEAESCGGAEGPRCAAGLDCVSFLLCAVGPCPGQCFAQCDEDADCRDDQGCNPVMDEGSYCTPLADPPT